MPIVAQEYIEVDDRGVAKLIGSRTKVRMIVIDTRSGMSPEAIHDEYPHLSMAQIYAALAYYHDHRDEIEAEIVEADRYVKEMRANHVPSFTRAELEARWRAIRGTEPPVAATEIGD